MANAAPPELPLVAAGVALVCLGLALGPPAMNGWLAYDRQAILGNEIWRLWSGHLGMAGDDCLPFAARPSRRTRRCESHAVTPLHASLAGRFYLAW